MTTNEYAAKLGVIHVKVKQLDGILATLRSQKDELIAESESLKAEYEASNE